MSKRTGLGAMARSIRLEAERRAAPLVGEEREAPRAMHSPAIPITEAYLREWMENDEELHALRDAEARPPLW